MNILVSLVNYNSRDHILSCLNDIFSQKTDHQFSVVVFDNNSPDNSADEIKKTFPKIKLIKHKQNLGFGKAHNEVAKEIEDYDGMLLINPDTRYREDTFERLFSFFESDNDIGIVSTKIVKFDGSADSNGGDFPTGVALLSWLFNLETFGVKRNFHRVDGGYYKESHQVDWVGGTFMLIKKELIKKMGLFNEKFFMYYEDVELCFRARNAGFKVMIYPEITIKHASGGSSDNPRFFQWSNEYKNLLLFYYEHYGAICGFLVKILIYISIVLRILAFGLLGKQRIAWTYWKVIRSI